MDISFLFYSDFDKAAKGSQGREGGDLTNLSGSSQQIRLAPACLPEGCRFLSSRRHITRDIKMQNTQLFLSNSGLLDKLHWRSSLCQECKSRLGGGGGKAACASQMPKLFSVYSVLSAATQQGRHSSLLHKGLCLSSFGLVSLRAVCLLYQASAVVLVFLQFIRCGEVCIKFLFPKHSVKETLGFQSIISLGKLIVSVCHKATCKIQVGYLGAFCDKN